MLHQLDPAAELNIHKLTGTIDLLKLESLLVAIIVPTQTSPSPTFLLSFEGWGSLVPRPYLLFNVQHWNMGMRLGRGTLQNI